MIKPTGNAALRAAREIAASLHPQSPWARDILAGKLDNEDAVRAALAAIPPEQDGYAEGRIAGLEAAKALVPYTSHAIGCAIYQRSWVSGEPPCTCGLDEAHAAIRTIANGGTEV